MERSSWCGQISFHHHGTRSSRRSNAMSIELVQDFISDEVRGQAARNPKNLSIAKSDKPDAIRVSGDLDLYELAKAITQESRWLK
jgi:hypothetical protein